MTEYMRDEYGQAYTLPGPFYDAAELIAEARRRGSHYFDPETTRYFSARYHELHAGAILIDSVRNVEAGRPRVYRLTVIGERGSMSHVADPETGAAEWNTLAKARRAAKRVCEACGVASWQVSVTAHRTQWGPVSAERQLARRIAQGVAS